MLRIIGAIFVMAGSSGLGFAYRHELYNAQKSLQYIRHILEMMISEVRYSKSTLPECCRQVGQKLDEPYRTAFLEIHRQLLEERSSSFVQCWEQEMGKCLGKLPISKREKEMVLAFAACGNMVDNGMQIRAIEQYRDMIDSTVKKRESVLAEQGRMAAGLGIMSGLLLTIVLL